MHRPHLPRRTGLFLLAGAWVFAALSLASFCATDWPSHAAYPYGPAGNWCGSIGAAVAYGLFAAVGAGAWPAVGLGGLAIVAAIWGRRIADPWMRGVGLLLLTATAAAAVHHATPGTATGLPEGSGGLVGIASAEVLSAHFGVVGTRLVLAVSFLVALVLAADDLLLLVADAAGRLIVRAVGKFGGFRLPTFKLPSFRLPSMPTLPRLALVTAGDREQDDREQDDAPAKPRRVRAAPVEADGSDDVAPATAAERPEIRPKRKPVLKEVAAPQDGADADDADDADAPAVVEAVVEAVVADRAATSAAPEEPAAPPRADIIVKLPSLQKARQTAPAQQPRELGDYQFPEWDDLGDAEHGFAEAQEAFVREQAAELEQALTEFGIDAKVVEIDTGPVITMYEIALAPGIKVSAITGLSNDIARALKATTIRIVAPIPGKNTVGIEAPNREKEKVRLKELMQIAPDKIKRMAIPMFLGKDASGEALITDLASMPHCLIAGTTGSGKSVCINTIIMSIMYTQRPDAVKLILVDPKVVEMAPFKDIPHLMCPVITDSGKATSVLEWACTKMDERYELLAEAGVRNLDGYNKMTPEELIERFEPSTPEEEAKIPKKMPYIVIIIDELADLMMTSGKEVESYIVRLSQKARAVGIHLVLATQRPQATVVTGLIKSNMPSKIAFRVASKMDSRIVLDQNGAELLLGQGDMLFLPPGASRPVRSQGTYIDDKEIRDSVKRVKALAEAQYEPELVQIKSVGGSGEGAERDELFEDAVRVVLETRRGSVSLLQRRLTIGYARASRLIEQMSEAGLVGAYKGSQAREATITLDEWDAAKAQEAADAEAGMTV